MNVGKICGLAATMVLVAGAARAAPAPDEVGKLAKPYAINLLNKTAVTSADLKGKVVVINRWATWCTPCKAEMVTFETYLRTHPGTDLKIYAVTTELSFPARKLEPLQQKLSYALGTSVSGRDYGIKGAVPTSYVIDRAGVVRFAAAGAFNDESFDALITPLLKEPAPAAIAQTAASLQPAKP
ncbi:MAG TPA: TlpA disulfide reductase family protein [Phenylobacterium sp.]|jgi:cytochrome c biogenesis protein CcmG/thiol:disulfide interchange protein DsbE|uniref:TlpA family protein disulfide reductase n=1 Tax=Phenylobacterium sp. TaxID=1871053 RepID=UPI002CDF23BC|nr:TlpA disulfide reductase family protein [Phenylobacterium sp.]HXA40469.1 TlpA disulfide reductase family protein [Phenylobacterium sp.]